MAIFTRKWVLVVTGIILGILSHYVITGWYTLIPWVVITPLVGMGCKEARQSVIGGILFGYMLFLTYLLMGYGGQTDLINLAKFLGFSMLFSLIGAICGLAGTYIGYSIRALWRSGKEDTRNEAG